MTDGRRQRVPLYERLLADAVSAGYIRGLAIDCVILCACVITVEARANNREHRPVAAGARFSGPANTDVGKCQPSKQASKQASKQPQAGLDRYVLAGRRGGRSVRG